MGRHHHFRPIFKRDDADSRGGGHDGFPNDGCGGCTRKGVDVQKHARDGASRARAETVSLDHGGDVVKQGVVCGRNEHVGRGGVFIHGWGFGLQGRGGQTQRRRDGGGLGVETQRRAHERVEHVGRLREGMLVLGWFCTRIPRPDPSDGGFWPTREAGECGRRGCYFAGAHHRMYLSRGVNFCGGTCGCELAVKPTSDHARVSIA